MATTPVFSLLDRAVTLRVDVLTTITDMPALAGTPAVTRQISVPTATVTVNPGPNSIDAGRASMRTRGGPLP